MANLNKYSGVVIAILAVAVVVLAALLLSQKGNNTPAAENTQNLGTPTSSASSTVTNPSSTPGNSAAQNTGSKPSSPSNTAKPALTGFVIHLITPVPGDVWTIAHSNPIAWDREAGVTGQIVLLDAAAKNIVGVILNQVGPHQTSYAWNTRDLYLSSTSPSKKDVVPGSYVIRISFDGNNLSPITSQPITIVQ